MSQRQVRDIVMLGAGRLGSRLAVALRNAGLRVVQVYNRTPGKGLPLARKVGASYTGDTGQLRTDADLYILAVADDAIPSLAASLAPGDRLLVHTSGSVGVEALAGASTRYGVIWPLQTFTARRRVSFHTTPVCVEGNTPEVSETLRQVAATISGQVHLLDSRQRGMLHLGAVFSSNFTNFIMAMAEELMKRNGIPFELLVPIIEQTAGNAHQGNLLALQTGPAARGDLAILEKHQALLAAYPDHLQLYRQISAMILKYRTPDGKL